MTFFSAKSQHPKLWERTCVLAALLAAGLCPSMGISQAHVPQPSFAAPEERANPQLVELDKRIKEANAAQVSGNPGDIADANRRLLAVLLRLMGELRVSEGAYPQAVELYRNSMELESSPGMHARLAEALQLAGKQDDAIREARLALADNPSNAHIQIMLGRAYLAKKQYSKADKVLTEATRMNPDINSLYLLAVSWLQAGGPDARKHADMVFAQMKAVAGDSGSLHVLMGRAYRDAGSMPDAVKQFKRAIELDPATPHAHCFLGLAFYSMNEWQPTPKATTEMLEELHYHPKDFLANYILGVLKASQHQYADADKYLSAAAEVNPKWPELYLYMGLDAYAQQDYKRAEPLLRKAVELTGSDESRSNYQIRRAYVDLGRILAKTGRQQEADVFFAKARALEDKLMHETQQKATAEMLAAGATKNSMGGYVPLKKKDDQGISIADASNDAAARVDASVMANSGLSPAGREAAEKEEDTMRPILGQSYSDLATAEAIQKQYPAALKHYEAAEQWNPKITGLAKNLGQAAYHADNYPEAIRGLSKAVKENPSSPALRAMLGMAYYQMKEYGNAATAFYPLGESAMTDPVVGYAWAASLVKTGDLKDAAQVLQIYESGAVSNQGLLLVGQLWIQIGDYDRAVTTLRRLLAADPGFPKAHFTIALADIRSEKWVDASAELQAELAKHPGDTEAMYNLGFVDLQELKNAEAMKLFRQVIAKKPDTANAQYQIGKLYMDQGKPQLALPYLEAAARLSPDTAYVHYQLQAAYRKLSRTADADREMAVYQKIEDASRAASTASIQQQTQQAQPKPE